MSAALAAERTVAACCRFHAAQHGVGRRGPSTGFGGGGVLAGGGGRGGGRPRRLVACGPDLPFPVAGACGHRRRSVPPAPGGVRPAPRTPRTPRRARRGTGDRARGAPQPVGDDGGPLRGRVRHGPAHVPRGPGAQPAAGDGEPLGPGGGRRCLRGLRCPLPALRPNGPADRVRTARRPCPTAGGDHDAVSRGGASGASRPVCGRRSPDPGGPCTRTAKPALRTERPPS